MAFVRTKRIGGAPYAYLVENNWVDGQARQSVSKYLGRIHQPQRAQQTGNVELNSHDFKNAVEALLVSELLAHGFTKEQGVLVKDGLSIKQGEWEVKTAKGKPAVIRINQGYLCNHTINQLISFAPGESDEATGFALARRLLDAGLAVQQDAFIALFSKAKGDE